MNATTTETARFECNAANLAAAVKRISGTVPRRSPKPILRAVRISVNGSVELAGTDCDLFHTETVDHETRRGERVALVNAAELAAAIRGNKGTMAIELGETGVAVIGNRSRQFLPAAGLVDEFPNVDHNEPRGVVLARWFGQAETLAAVLQSAEYARDYESSRFALSAVRLELEPTGTARNSTGIRAIASDGRRLVVSSAAWNDATRNPVVALVPPVAVNQIIRAAAGKSAAMVLVDVIGTAAELPDSATFCQVYVFNADGVLVSAITTRLLEGRFPRWQDVIPDAPRVAVVRAESLATLLEPIAKAVPRNAEHCGIRLRYRRNGSRLYAFYRSPNGRKMKTVVAAVSIAFNGRHCFNVHYLAELAAGFGKRDSLLSVHYSNASSAALFRGDFIAGGVPVDVRAVVMPIADV